MGRGNLLVRTVVYVSDAVMLPPIPNPRTEDWGCAEMRAVLVFGAAEIPKVGVVGDDVAAAPPTAVVEPGSVVPALTSFATAVLVYRVSRTLLRAVCLRASRLLAAT